MVVCLTAKEILCAAALLGVPEVIAIPDEFQNMGQRQLQAELLSVQRSLEEKGILQLDFNGNCTLNLAHSPSLEALLRGEKVIIVDAQLTSRGQAGCAYYISGQRVVRSVPKNWAFELSEITPEQAIEELCGLSWAKAEELSCKPCLISQRQLNQIKAGGSVEALEKAGMSDKMRAIISDAFSFKTNFYSFALWERQPGGTFIGLIFIDDARGTVKLTPTVQDDQNYILIEVVEQETLKAELRGAVRSLLQVETGG